MLKLEEGWLTVALLAAMVTVASWGIAAASWSEGLWAAWMVGVLGVLAGLALAKSRFRGFAAALFAALYGLFFVGFFTCFLLEGTWHERSVELVTRIGTFVYKAIFGGTSRDALPFPVFVGLIFWAVGASGAWAVFRRGAVWPAILPGGAGLLVNAYYYLGPARIDLYLAVYAVLALLLLARLSLLAREREWRKDRVAFTSDMRLEFLRAGLVVALAGVVIGWAAPGFSASPTAANTWNRMTQQWTTVRETWMRLFAAVRAYGSNVNDFYGDSLALGGPARLDDDPIMDITIGPLDEDAPGVENLIPVARYYWRGVVWDEYVDGRWKPGGAAQFEEVDPFKADLRHPAYRLRRDMSAFVISHVTASSKLYVPPQPKWVDRPASFEVLALPGGAADVATVRSRDILRQGESYRAIASISVADEESLRSAGTEYPQWVLEHYLQLPGTLTPRTLDLAWQIVAEAGAENPYDQAVAITNWLRANIRYDQNIDPPPSDVEPADYLLFVSRSGYCNYYATAEVLLLRALGIPARFAAGFAEGTFDPQTGVYHVLERDAHAWPEVYFPNYGWIEFEPTVSQPPLVRPERRAAEDDLAAAPDPAAERPASTPAPERDDGPERTAADQPSALDLILAAIQRYLAAALISAGGLAVIALVAGAILIHAGLIGWEGLGRAGEWVLRTRGLPVPSVITSAYIQLERAARWLGLSLPLALTPHERAAALGEALPEACSGVETITEQYVVEQYSPRAANPEAARSAWRAIRLPVWREGVQVFFRSWTEDDLARAVRAQRRKR
jgi:transglutaminase-like putative cysteine protease